MENTHRKLLELKEYLQNNSLGEIHLTNLPQYFWEVLGECIEETKPLELPKSNEQKECEKFICNYISEFLTENIDKINIKKIKLSDSGTTKEKLLKDVKTDFLWAIWVLNEVMNWGMDKDYTKELCPTVYEHENFNFRVIKLNGKYIKIIYNKDYTHTVSFAKEKTKMVTYFD
jgi:hypothetical protein